MRYSKPIIINDNPVVINYYIEVQFPSKEMDRYRALTRKPSLNELESEEVETIGGLTMNPTVKFGQIGFYDSCGIDLNHISKNYWLGHDAIVKVMAACAALEEEVKKKPITLKEWVGMPDDLPF